MHATRPVDCEHDIACAVGKIYDHFMDDCAHDALLEAHIRIWIVPDRHEVISQV
jgi:hypothetical protein